MKKLFILNVLMLAGIMGANAQEVLDGAYVKDHIKTTRPSAYTPLRESDVMWSCKYWRYIDLKEKINLPLAYPAHNSIKDRKSLIDVLMGAITQEGTITAYKPDNDEFTLPMTKAEAEAIGIMGNAYDTVMVPSPDPPYDPVPTVRKKEFNPDDVVGYRLKEESFFDKQRSVIETRIIGIAPMIYDKDDQGNVREGAQKKALFWAYFPESRLVLSRAEVFNRFNDAERRSFDDIFIKRMFGSYIYKQANVYDRRIEDYKSGLDALLEAQKIKTDLFNFEHDLWEY